MTTDPRQKLEQAIAEYARHMEPEADFDMLTDFVIVAAWSTIDGDNATYCVLNPDRKHAPHRTLGLLQVGLDFGAECDHDHG